MSELKTKRNKGDVEKFLNTVQDEKRKKDSFEVLEIMKKITRAKPEMWGKSIIGFGSVDYKYASGREGTWFRVGFSPRKQALTMYLMYGVEDNPGLKNLGKYKTGKACLYIKKLEDVDMKVLKKLIKESYENPGYES